MFDFLAETLAGDQMTADSGRSAGFSWTRPAPGVLIFEPAAGYSKNVVISAAIHGNETAPVEIVSALISALLTEKYQLKVRLMVILRQNILSVPLSVQCDAQGRTLYQYRSQSFVQRPLWAL